MVWSLIPSGSLDDDEIDVPSWSRPTTWLPIEIGCLAKVLPLGGPIWMNELVVIIEAINYAGSKPSYKVMGRLGYTVLPYYALEIKSYPSGSQHR
ncbi:hypothetical protein EBR57_11140 [bacterium]|nr:hypothetical protein [bacterium]